MHLTAWKAKRAGGRITVYGTGPDGKPAKIVGIDQIVPTSADCRATDKDGNTHVLTYD